MTGPIITIDASGWHSVLDSYADVLRHVGAPDWHGESADALVDSMIYGGINALEPPYVIRLKLKGVDGLRDDIAREIRVVRQAIAEARRHKTNTTGIDAAVEVEIVSMS